MSVRDRGASTVPAARDTRTAGTRRLQFAVIFITLGRPGVSFGSSTLSVPSR